MLSDLITIKAPPPNRQGFCTDGKEQYLSEGAVILAYGMHLLRTTDARSVALHPDGEHGKIFDFRAMVEAQGFAFSSALGSTAYGGTYQAPDGREIKIWPKSGLGDVVAETPAGRIVAECKGGIVNTKHAGQLSRMRRGLCEAVGLMLASEWDNATRQVAVVPRTPVTLAMAKKLAPRAVRAGLSIALVDEVGNVTDIKGAAHAF